MDYQQKQLEAISHHQFDSWSKDLMSKPVVFDPWQTTQVGENNDGVYRQQYPLLPVQDNHEPLVNCLNFGLIGKDYYLNILWDQNNLKKESLLSLDTKHFYPFAWVRLSIAQKLQHLDAILRQHGLFLVINSGWRHPQVQELATKLMSAYYGDDYLKIALAPSSITPHSTGGAVDLELWSLQLNQPLSFSYPNDIINSFVLEQKSNLTETETIKRNIRRILFHLLSKNFVAHPGEFWHFGYGDPLSSYLTHQPFAVYGYVNPPAAL